jgi:hypothetical protein
MPLAYKKRTAYFFFAIFVQVSQYSRALVVTIFLTVLTRIKYQLLIVTMLLLTSCAKPLLAGSTFTDRHELSAASLSEINGDYEIVTIDTARRTLTASFMPDKRYHFGNLPGQDDKISIKVISDNKIKMTLIDNGKIIRKRTIKYNLIDNCLEFNRSYISPFWVIINGYTNSIVRIGLLADGNLTMDISVLTIGFIGILPFTGAGETEYNLIYARKKENR